jgi:hypothetical protein
VTGLVEDVSVDVAGRDHAGVAEDPADLHEVQSQVDDQVARKGVAQVVETQANEAVFEPG